MSRKNSRYRKQKSKAIKVKLEPIDEKEKYPTDEEEIDEGSPPNKKQKKVQEIVQFSPTHESSSSSSSDDEQQETSFSTVESVCSDQYSDDDSSESEKQDDDENDLPSAIPRDDSAEDDEFEQLISMEDIYGEHAAKKIVIQLPDFNGRKYFEVEIDHEETDLEMRIGLCDDKDHLVIDSYGFVKNQDLETGKFKRGDVIGVLYSFGSVFFTYNGKKIAKPFEWENIEGSFGIVDVQDRSAQRYLIHSVPPFKYSNITSNVTPEITIGPVLDRLNTVRNLLSSIEYDYLKMQKRSHSDITKRVDISREDISILSDQELFGLKKAILECSLLLDDEVRDRLVNNQNR